MFGPRETCHVIKHPFRLTLPPLKWSNGHETNILLSFGCVSSVTIGGTGVCDEQSGEFGRLGSRLLTVNVDPVPVLLLLLHLHVLGILRAPKEECAYF